MCCYGIDQILLLRVERRQVLYAIVSVLLDLNWMFATNCKVSDNVMITQFCRIYYKTCDPTFVDQYFVARTRSG